MDYVFQVVDTLSALTLLADILVVTMLLVFALEKISGKETHLLRWIAKHGLILMLIVALIATLGSLFLSEVAGWTPCKDCWLQRIFMYPLVPILAVALWKKDRSIATYVVVLCCIGACISIVHYTTQLQALFAAPTLDTAPCDATGVSCAKTPFLHFGYITIPVMALSAFLLNACASVAMMSRRKHAD